MSILDDFMIRAALAGIGVVLAAAPLGCFVIWRRMAFFGDASAHAALLGVALALAFNISIIAGVLSVSLIVALLVTALNGRGMAVDTMLGVMAHSALAFGLFAVSFVDGVRVDLMAYLFGDILAVDRMDLVIVWGGAACVLGLLLWRWQSLLTATLNADLSIASGNRPKQEEIILSVALALTVTVSIKVVGSLLIASMLLIPASAARPFARSPEQMALIGTLIGILSVLGGLQLAFRLDTPTGPTIVCCAAGLFALSNLTRLLRAI